MNKKDLEIVDNFLSAVTSLDPTGASGFIVDGLKTILSIRDKIYLSKYQEFWRAPEENKIKIEDFIRRTKEQEDWQKVGGDFMLVIDSFSCFDKCHYYGKAWIAWLEKKINVNEFQEIIDILQKVFIGDLNSLINNEDFNFLDIYSSNGTYKAFKEEEFEAPFIMRLCNCGIALKWQELEDNPIANSKEYFDRRLPLKIERYWEITEVGKKLIEILKTSKQNF